MKAFLPCLVHSRVSDESFLVIVTGVPRTIQSFVHKSLLPVHDAATSRGVVEVEVLRDKDGEKEVRIGDLLTLIPFSYLRRTPHF